MWGLLASYPGRFLLVFSGEEPACVQGNSWITASVYITMSVHIAQESSLTHTDSHKHALTLTHTQKACYGREACCAEQASASDDYDPTELVCPPCTNVGGALQVRLTDRQDRRQLAHLVVKLSCGLICSLSNFVHDSTLHPPSCRCAQSQSSSSVPWGLVLAPWKGLSVHCTP